VSCQPGLGRRLKALRVSRGLSLKEVGAETGVSSSFISMVETGRNELSVGRLIVLADFYGVGLDDIVAELDADPSLYI
jgi:transcriptional regulator with XRE-family HTH domain